MLLMSYWKELTRTSVSLEEEVARVQENLYADDLFLIEEEPFVIHDLDALALVFHLLAFMTDTRVEARVNRVAKYLVAVERRRQEEEYYEEEEWQDTPTR